MEIIVGAVAEHAWEENGSLSICRIFDTITCPSLPYVLPRVSVALRFLFDASEVGIHSLKVDIMDANEQKIIEGDGEINLVVHESQKSRKFSFTFVLNGQNVIFQNPGAHFVRIRIDGEVLKEIPIYLVRSQDSNAKLN